jgi:hypothetical protein
MADQTYEPAVLEFLRFEPTMERVESTWKASRVDFSRL